MNKLQKEKYICDISTYFDKHFLHALFAELYENLLREKPADPIASILTRLRSGSQKRVFVMGTPGCGVKRLALELGETMNATAVSMGDLLRKEVMKATAIGQDAESFIAQGRLAPDDVVVALLKRTLSDAASEAIVVEGFPQTAAQARFLLEEGLGGDRFLRFNFSRDRAFAGLCHRLGSGTPAAQNYLEACNFHTSQVQTVLRGLVANIDAEAPAVIPRALDVLRLSKGLCSSMPVRAFCFAEESSSLELATALGAVFVNGDHFLENEWGTPEALRTRLGRPDARIRGVVVYFGRKQIDSVCQLFEGNSPVKWVLAEHFLLNEGKTSVLRGLGHCIGLTCASPAPTELREIINNLLRPV